MATRANLQSAERLVTAAVLATVEALELDKKDKAAAKLAVQYAEAIDEAHRNAAWADRLLAQAPKVRKLYDDDAADEWEKEIQALQARLTVQNTLNHLGPKLAALLADLGATPMGRAVMAKRSQGGTAVPHPANPLAALRVQMAERDAG